MVLFFEIFSISSNFSCRDSSLMSESRCMYSILLEGFYRGSLLLFVSFLSFIYIIIYV